MEAAKIAASTGISAGSNGRNAGFGRACPMASKYSEQLQSQQDRADDYGPFDEDVIAPVLWERRVGFAHRAISQLVPSLESFITTPIAASSSRMRSDSPKSLRVRAAVRSAINPSICVASIPLASCFRFFHSAALSDSKPSTRREAANAPRS